MKYIRNAITEYLIIAFIHFRLILLLIIYVASRLSNKVKARRVYTILKQPMRGDEHRSDSSLMSLTHQINKYKIK